MRREIREMENRLNAALMPGSGARAAPPNALTALELLWGCWDFKGAIAMQVYFTAFTDGGQKYVAFGRSSRRLPVYKQSHGRLCLTEINSLDFLSSLTRKTNASTPVFRSIDGIKQQYGEVAKPATDYAATAAQGSRASLSTPPPTASAFTWGLGFCKDLHRGCCRYHRPARNRRGVPCGRPIRESPGNHKGCP